MSKKEQNKRYYTANKDKIKEYNRAHKEEKKERDKGYYMANKEKLKDRQKRYYTANQEDRKEYSRKYREANKEVQNTNCINYAKQRRVTDPAYKLIYNLRVRQGRALKGKASTTKGLGCDSNFFREYIENQWTEGMTWNNYGNKEGQWSLDHIIPLSLYYTQPELLPQLIHYTNMQPMWHVENVKKGKMYS